MLPVGHLSLASPRAHFTQPAAVDYDMRMCSASIAAELRRDERDVYGTFLFIFPRAAALRLSLGRASSD
jgi:hypothetical protein